MHEYENATFCCEKGEGNMKRKKLALMLAMSLTFTSFSGAGWPVYADELPEIVEDEAEDADAAEYVEPEEEQQQSNEEETETAALYGDFVESVEVVDEAEAPEVYSEDGDENGAGFEIQNYTEEVYVDSDETVMLSVTATCTQGTLSYQWYEVDEDGYVIGEIISREAMCRVPTKTAFYECKVSNGYWEDEVKCSVGVDSGFAINGEQKTIIVHASEYATLSVNVVTDYPDALTYQWEQWDENEYEWKKIEGAISSKYQTGAMETGESYGERIHSKTERNNDLKGKLPSVAVEENDRAEKCCHGVDGRRFYRILQFE